MLVNHPAPYCRSKSLNDKTGVANFFFAIQGHTSTCPKRTDDRIEKRGTSSNKNAMDLLANRKRITFAADDEDRLPSLNTSAVANWRRQGFTAFK